MHYFLDITKFILIITILLLSILFIQIKHPLAIGLTLLIQTIVITLLTGLINKTYWFSYILFLVFVGGILVLFVYVTSLASNEIFSIPSKNIVIAITSITILSLTFLIIDKGLIFSFIENNEIQSISFIKSYILENQIDLNKLYSYPTNFITIILINYLLITLIAIVKITNLFYGPLRPINN